MKEAIFKFNNGNGAILCSKCHIIIKTGKDFTQQEKEAMIGKRHLEEQFCDKCKNK